MRFMIYLAVLCLSICAAVPAFSVGIAAGTNLQLIAQADYTNNSGEIRSTDPAYATLTVLQVAGVSSSVGITPTSTSPGQTYYVPITIVNKGNGNDSFNLSTTAGIGWVVSIIHDDNQDGIHQSSETQVISNTGTMIADGYTYIFVKIVTPVNSSTTSNIKLYATSTYNATQGYVAQDLLIPPPPALPTIEITSPTNLATYSTNLTSVNIAGNATSSQTISSITWTNSKGGSGNCTGTLSWNASNIVLKPGSNLITVTITDSKNNTATDTLTITFTDNTNPTVAITSPTNLAAYTTTQATITLAGTANDNTGISSVSWSNDKGGSGTCTGTSSWTTSAIALQNGQNIITITATDSVGLKGTFILTVTSNQANPIISITTPTSIPTLAVNKAKVSLSGTSSYSLPITNVTWTSDNGTSGVCTGTTTWSVNNINLTIGINTIMVTVNAANGKTASDVITVTYYKSEPGTKWDGLALISLPIIPETTDPLNVVGFVDNGWSCFDTANDVYYQYPDVETTFTQPEQTPGRTFWAKFGNNMPNAIGMLPDQTTPQILHLKAGWNLVGSKFVEDVPWNITLIKVQEAGKAAIALSSAAGIVENYLWGWKQSPNDKYNGSYYMVSDFSINPSANNKFETWKGYWIHAAKDCDLIIPAP